MHELIKKRIKHFLTSEPTEQQLGEFLENILVDEKPTQAFHQLDFQALKQPILVYTKLMVQDIREQCYFYPYIIQKPYTAESKVLLFHFGHSQQQFSPQIVKDPDYRTQLKDKESIICTTVSYETAWKKTLEKVQIKQKTYEMIVTKPNLFKLGQVFAGICLYDPQSNLLFYLRKAKAQEIQKWENYPFYIKQEVSIETARKEILKYFQEVYTQKYSYLLLYSLIATEPFFISAQKNIFQVIQKLAPRVCQLKIKAPFKESLFPFKNEEEQLVQTPMQMSQQHTFVIIDFCEFSNDHTIKIEQPQIDNLKALKVYVEEGQTIYRWQFGESLIAHHHTGMIVKASTILNPQYVIPQETPKDRKEQKQFPELSETQLKQFRCYIQQCRSLNPVIEKEREQIEKQIKTDLKKFNEIALLKVMQLSKLHARSRGSQEITLEDFKKSCRLFFQ